MGSISLYIISLFDDVCTYVNNKENRHFRILLHRDLASSDVILSSWAFGCKQSYYLDCKWDKSRVSVQSQNSLEMVRKIYRSCVIFIIPKLVKIVVVFAQSTLQTGTSVGKQKLFQLFLQTILSIGKSQLNYLNKFRQTQITKHETNKAHKN